MTRLSGFGELLVDERSFPFPFGVRVGRVGGGRFDLGSSGDDDGSGRDWGSSFAPDSMVWKGEEKVSSGIDKLV